METTFEMSYLKFPTPSAEQFRSFSSETARYRHLTAKYLEGFGVDVASQGDRVVPWACSYDLPLDEFLHYSNGNPAKGPIHLRGHAHRLPFEPKSLDFVYSSHFLEDVLDWLPVLREWDRVLAVGGNMVILVPDKFLWNTAIAAGQPPNCEHRHEAYVGELTSVFKEHFGHYNILEDRLTNVVPGDYTIIFAAERIR